MYNKSIHTIIAAWEYLGETIQDVSKTIGSRSKFLPLHGKLGTEVLSKSLSPSGAGWLLGGCGPALLSSSQLG